MSIQKTQPDGTDQDRGLSHTAAELGMKRRGLFLVKMGFWRGSEGEDELKQLVVFAITKKKLWDHLCLAESIFLSRSFLHFSPEWFGFRCIR